jgi:hypothetical protein
VKILLIAPQYIIWPAQSLLCVSGMISNSSTIKG